MFPTASCREDSLIPLLISRVKQPFFPPFFSLTKWKPLQAVTFRTPPPPQPRQKQAKHQIGLRMSKINQGKTVVSSAFPSVWHEASLTTGNKHSRLLMLYWCWSSLGANKHPWSVDFVKNKERGWIFTITGVILYFRKCLSFSFKRPFHGG